MQFHSCCECCGLIYHLCVPRLYRVMGGLNFLRFLLIRDKPDSNMVGTLLLTLVLLLSMLSRLESGVWSMR